jgi:DNA (cytosine-5)-methyltransferase 1
MRVSVCPFSRSLTRDTGGDMKVIDVCAGAGGLSLAWHRAGCEVLGVEMDASAAAAHVAGAGPCLIADLRIFDARPYRARVTSGGCPCPPFSEQGKKETFADPRSDLIMHLLRVANETCSEACVLENVKGMASKRGGERAIDRVLVSFAEAGYPATFRVLNAADYGVPQCRERVFVVGFRDAATAGRFAWPPPLPRGKRSQAPRHAA